MFLGRASSLLFHCLYTSLHDCKHGCINDRWRSAHIVYCMKKVIAQTFGWNRPYTIINIHLPSSIQLWVWPKGLGNPKQAGVCHAWCHILHPCLLELRMFNKALTQTHVEAILHMQSHMKHAWYLLPSFIGIHRFLCCMWIGSNSQNVP